VQPCPEWGLNRPSLSLSSWRLGVHLTIWPLWPVVFLQEIKFPSMFKCLSPDTPLIWPLFLCCQLSSGMYCSLGIQPSCRLGRSPLSALHCARRSELPHRLHVQHASYFSIGGRCGQKVSFR
jgi:hypothetical protein